MRVIACLLTAVLAAGSSSSTGRRLSTQSDRAAFAAWFVLLADAQFYRTTTDVTDCAALVRHAVREALRPHTEEWLRRARLPFPQVFPDVIDRPQASDGALPVFLVGEHPPRYAEFADARTIVQLNARPVGRDVGALRPGDLLYFHRPGERLPDHLMVFVGPSALAPEASDWVVYHTGPDRGFNARRAGGGPGDAPDGGAGAGEVRKVRLADLLRHPEPRWRPRPANPAFAGVFRLTLLS